jgi:hypothetical protein
MFVLSRSLLNRGYILMKVLKNLASVFPMCILHVTFLSKIKHRYKGWILEEFRVLTRFWYGYHFRLLPRRGKV